MFWPCRAIGENGERCALDAGHEGRHVPLPAPAVPPPDAQAVAPPGTPGSPSGAPGSLPPPPPPPVAPPVTTPPGDVAWMEPGSAGPGTIDPDWLDDQQRRSGARVRGLRPMALFVALANVVIIVIVIALALGGLPGGEAAPATLRPAYVPPGGQAAASPEPVVTAQPPTAAPGQATTPGRSPAPGSTPGPGATPVSTAPAPGSGDLGFGDLAYSATACFEVDREDADGDPTAGGEARYALTVRNRADERSRHLWIGIRTTDQFTTNPLATRASWTGRPKAFADATSLVIAGPRLEPGSTRLRWRVLYQTPIDVHATVWIAEGPNPAKGRMTLEEIQAASPLAWDAVTDIRSCR